MKKIQLVFAIVAVLTAGAGVLGNAMQPPDAYFQTESSMDFSCDTSTLLDPCETGIGDRCVINDNGKSYYINKKVGGSNPCVEHRRPTE